MKKAKEELNSFFFCVAEKDRPTPYSQELMGGAYSTVFAFPSPFSFRAPAPLLVIHTQRDIDIDIDTDICTYIYDGTAETSHKPKKKRKRETEKQGLFPKAVGKNKNKQAKKKKNAHPHKHTSGTFLPPSETVVSLLPHPPTASDPCSLHHLRTFLPQPTEEKKKKIRTS